MEENRKKCERDIHRFGQIFVTWYSPAKFLYSVIQKKNERKSEESREKDERLREKNIKFPLKNTLAKKFKK